MRENEMNVAIVKWGNSQGIRLSGQLLEQIGASVGQQLEVTVQNATLVLKPARPARMSLETLLEGLSPDNRHSEIGTGDAVGKEVF
jgi:antitoxin MazE